MDSLYALTFYTYPGMDAREELPIGLFTDETEAWAVEARYRREVPGFKDYYCDSSVIPVPVIGGFQGKRKVYSVCGWNLDEDGEETDILRSDCYRTREQARSELRRAKEASPRQKWSLDQWVIGECEWSEGFTREYPSGREPVTLAQINQRLEEAQKTRKYCRVEFQYSENYLYLYPLKWSEKLFLSMEEDDFQLDGYTIRHLRDVEKMDLGTEKSQQMCQAEGLPDQLTTPDVDVTDWCAVFASLKELGKNIIVEQETLDERIFRIGCVEAVGAESVTLRHFDGDGVWQEPEEIPYEKITAVSFDSRYVRVFSKYLT